MPMDPSAFSTLGLEPGADSAAVERAYKRLIKRYHPDREGGDTERAAEITQAYRELKRGFAKDQLILNDLDSVAGRRFTWVGAALASVGAALILFLASGPISRLTAVPPMPLGPATATGRGSDV